MFAQKDIDRFWNLIDKSEGEMGCWFPRSKMREDRNEPQFHYTHSFVAGGVSYVLHKFAYIVKYGPIPDGTIVRHRCGYGCCCNPHHLVLGTQKQNQWDRYARKQAGVSLGELATYEDVPGYRPVKGWD